MNATTKKILIVDDEPSVRAYLRALLEDNGYSAVTAENGKTGFEMAKSEEPDLVLLDITMPEESGVRMFRNLQENSKTKDIPVIVVTGISHDFKDFIENRKQVAPPAAYFDKPIDNEEFINKVNEILADKN